MKANVFVKKFGWDAASNIVDGWIYRDFDDSYHITDGIYCNLPFEPTNDCGTLSLYDLKRLVESYELVESYGGLGESKEYIYYHGEYEAVCDENGSVCDYVSNLELIEAIADVESCL